MSKSLNMLKKLILHIITIGLTISLLGCEPVEECTDIRLKIEEGNYLDGWVYVKDISSLDNESNPTGRILFALYVNEGKSEEHAVLKITKLTVPDSYNGLFIKASYDENTNTAISLDKNALVAFAITYDSTGIKINE